jgi:tRNA (guanine37-N1)-methyltransferase
LVGVREALAKLLPPEKARLMYGAYDIIGNLIVTKVPYELEDHEREVGEALHMVHPRVRRVFRVIGETEEIERNRQLRLIWSEPKRRSAESSDLSSNLGRTVYKEHGCRFVVDVEKVFFTPRLSYERMRIAEQVKPGEVAANIFGGVGTYSIIIAKVCPRVERVYTIDVNPFAHELAKENTIINRCSEKVIPILGDAKAICGGQLKDLCTRVIMPLPEAASSFLDSAVMAMKEENECMINFYAEISGKEVENKTHKIIEQTKKTIMSCGVKSCEASSWRIVREVGPRKYHIAIDLRTVK